MSDESDPTGATDDPSSLEEQTAAAEAAMAEARARLADVPVDVVVANHTIGLHELAAIHLSSDPPDLASAQLAIDAVGCLVDGLGDRLGDHAEALRDALANLRMAFVTVKSRAGQDADTD